MPVIFEELKCGKDDWLLMLMYYIFRSCSLVEDVLIGANTLISDNTVVSKSMIGKNCTIGKNVTIKGSHIMDNVTIKDNCQIINSFIDEHCVIEEKCSIECGTIIASNVNVESGSQLKGNILESTETEKGNSCEFICCDM